METYKKIFKEKETNFEKVTYEKFYSIIGNKDVVLKLEGKYPYTTYFKNRRNEEVVGYTKDKDYFINKKFN